MNPEQNTEATRDENKRTCFPKQTGYLSGHEINPQTRREAIHN